MTGVQSKQVRSEGNSSASRGRRGATWRRRIILCLSLVIIFVIAIVVNSKPIQHLAEAKNRLEESTSQVAGLEEKTTAMQSRLSKLMQPDYLEELARNDLTYALPEEDLFIITSADLSDAADSTSGDPEDGFTSQGGAETANQDDDAPGFLEGLMLGIANLF